MPNSRQIALLVWLAVLGLWAITMPGVRSGLRDLIRTAATLKLVIPLAGLMAWMSAEVWIGHKFGLWDSGLAADTAFWFFGPGLALFFAFSKVSKAPGFLRQKAIGVLGPLVVLEGLVDALVFPLLVELVTQPLFFFVGALLAVAERDHKYRPVKKLLNGLIIVIGVVLLAHIMGTVVIGWDHLDRRTLALQIAFPVWMTLGLLPFIYAFTLIAEYEMAFLRLGLMSEKTRAARLRSKLAMLTGFHVKVHELASFGGAWQHDIASASSFREARGVIEAFRATQQKQAREEAEARERLVRFAGVDGVRVDGKRLDQREFEQTADALRWLATCMMGWYRHDDRYVPDLLERLSDDFTSYGLPKPSGITMRVASSGQAWYAWRRTITGWCFAIGAAGPPPDQWEYDGPEPPTRFPGEDPSWGSQPFGSAANPNW